MEKELQQETTAYGILIRNLREERNMTQEELAYLSMTDVQQIRDMERGEAADAETLLLVSNTLGVYPSALREGRIAGQERTELRDMLERISQDLKEIGKNDAYIKAFLEKYEIQTERYRPKKKEETETYVVFDTLHQEYVTENGKLLEFIDIHDALAYADRLNSEELRQEALREDQEEQSQEEGLSQEEASPGTDVTGTEFLQMEIEEPETEQTIERKM